MMTVHENLMRYLLFENLTRYLLKKYIMIRSRNFIQIEFSRQNFVVVHHDPFTEFSLKKVPVSLFFAILREYIHLMLTSGGDRSRSRDCS